MLAANRFTELATLLWFWVKIYRNEGAYVKMWDCYDSRLRQDYPLWDEKGNLIELNDPEKIKSGEQIKLGKDDNYESNRAKFKDFKMPTAKIN
jgi:hypothetical protein